MYERQMKQVKEKIEERNQYGVAKVGGRRDDGSEVS